jgi:hypothetical protein
VPSRDAFPISHTPEQRIRRRDRVLEIARSDPRITGGALTGSSAGAGEDRWSDVDLAFGLADGVLPETVLVDWTERFEQEFGVVHHWDLRGGSTVYRVFLLGDGLELDVGLMPAAELGARGPSFRLVFGESSERPPLPEPDTGYLIGLGWHHARHAFVAIERGQAWKAEFYVSALKDHALALACIRLGQRAEYARGIDRLPAEVSAPYEEALARSLDAAELRRALAVATDLFLGEVAEVNAALAADLRRLLVSA